MKELTIEEKAQRYDDAISTAKKFYTPDSNNVNLKADLEMIFPELKESKESEDEGIRNYLINFVKINEGINLPPDDAKKALDYLEKQGQTFTKKDVEDAYLKGISDTKNELEKQGEPKFHEGEWVVFNNKHQSIYQVERIEDGYYILRHTHGGTLRVCILHDKSLRPWTIQDAKDGDVLVAHECYVIFKEIDGLNIKCYCTYHYMGFNPSFYVCTLQNKEAFHPATKEQRNDIMKSIDERGWL